MKENKGFSLVELSVTLIIIGLVIAAISGGIHLLHAARINKVISEFAGYKEAVSNFYQKFESLPGDMDNASDYWTNCGGSASICNGDGNERILYNVADATDESFTAWLHMQNAGMIAGDFTGTGLGVAVLDTNTPRAVIKGTGYILEYGKGLFPNSNSLIFAAPTASNTLTSAAINATDAYKIDKKTDDGSPIDGEIRSSEGAGSTECIDETPDPDIYNSTSETTACVMAVDLGDII